MKTDFATKITKRWLLPNLHKKSHFFTFLHLIFGYFKFPSNNWLALIAWCASVLHVSLAYLVQTNFVVKFGVEISTSRDLAAENLRNASHFGGEMGARSLGRGRCVGTWHWFMIRDMKWIGTTQICFYGRIAWELISARCLLGEIWRHARTTLAAMRSACKWEREQNSVPIDLVWAHIAMQRR